MNIHIYSVFENKVLLNTFTYYPSFFLNTSHSRVAIAFFLKEEDYTVKERQPFYGSPTGESPPETHTKMTAS